MLWVVDWWDISRGFSWGRRGGEEQGGKIVSERCIVEGSIVISTVSISADQPFLSSCSEDACVDCSPF